ncbi:MAG: YdeI/OmpD-associated family protein [Cytophagaceae bacterium]
MNQIEEFYPKTVIAWRKWLEKNHAVKESVWLVMYKKSSSKPSVSWAEAVEVALCFGWIDSKKMAIDHEKSIQFFSKRKVKSTWSKINKEKVEKLIEAGLMTQAGMQAIEIAKKNGAWNILDEVEKLIIPSDLEKAFKNYKGSKNYFESLSKSSRKVLLQWIALAKRPETRQKRIEEIAKLASQQKKPRQF